MELDPTTRSSVTVNAFGILATIASTQHGVISVQQARAHGIDRRHLKRAADAGMLDQLHSDVFRFAAVPEELTQLVHAAVLQVPESRASHESALHLHGVDRVPNVVALTVPPGATSSRRGIRIHRFNDLVQAHIETVDGVATTTLPRAVVDVASRFSRSRLDELLDRVTITERRTTPASIAATLRQVERRGRRRVGVLAALLDMRRPGEPMERSILERDTDRLIDSTGLPRPLHEHPVDFGDGYMGYLDRTWAEALLILEIDGRTWHARESAMANDRARDRRAARAGYLTLRVLGEEVRTQPEAVIDDLVETHRLRIDQLRAA